MNSTGGGETLVTCFALNDGGVAARTITKSGNGTLTLATAATSLLDGTKINIAGGVLNSNLAAALGTFAAVDVASGATFNVGATQQLGALSGAAGGSVAIGAGFTLTIGNTNNLSSTFGGVLSGATGNLVKAGTGTLSFTNNNTYGGTTAVNAGTLQLNAASNTLPSATVLTLANANNVATLDLNGHNQTLPGFTIGGASNGTSTQGIVNVGTGGTLTLAGNVTYTSTNNPTATQQINLGTLDLGAATRTFTIGDSTATAADFSISSLIQNGGIAKAGAGTLVLSNASNTYAGGTSVTAGLISVAADSALGDPTAGTLTLNGGGLQVTGTALHRL